MKKHYGIYAILLLGVILGFAIPAIPQDPAYHNFSDQRKLLNIAHFWNVVSNLPFVIVSAIALFHLLKTKTLAYPPPLFVAYLIFFAAMGSIGIGSAYYHLRPTNATLFWDRLPMTLAFMAFTAIIIGEYISEKIALKLLVPLILLGTTSVIYWHFTEQAGHGDLRPYAYVQYVPMLIIPMILFMFPHRYSHSAYLWGMFAAYIGAKIFEVFDAHIFLVVSTGGHPIKHLFAALAPYLFYLALKKRHPIVS